MAKATRSPGRFKVKDIINTLLNSEIPEIQNIVGELAACTQQLDKHSQKLKGYAVRIQELSGEEIPMPRNTGLGKRLKSLEQALTEVAGKASRLPTFAGAKPEVPFEPAVEAKIVERVEKKDEVQAEVVEQEVGRFRLGGDTFITPEGFRVRRRYNR